MPLAGDNMGPWGLSDTHGNRGYLLPSSPTAMHVQGSGGRSWGQPGIHPQGLER